MRTGHGHLHVLGRVHRMGADHVAVAGLSESKVSRSSAGTVGVGVVISVVIASS